MEFVRKTDLIRKSNNNFRIVSSRKALKNIEIVGFYFAAQWSPSVRRFTPKLANCYKILKEREESFEIIFVSEDSNDKEMKEHMLESHADWLAVSVERDDELGEILHNWFGIEGIPALIILRRNGYVVTMEGRMDIQVIGYQAYYAWLDGRGNTSSPQSVTLLSLRIQNNIFVRFCNWCCG